MRGWLPPLARLLAGGRHFDIREARRQEVAAQRVLTETRGRVEKLRQPSNEQKRAA